MRGNEIRQGNKLVGVQKLHTLMQSTREMPVQTVKLLQGAVEATMTKNGPIFVGRVYDSCIYRIGCGSIYEEFALKFATADERNKFANRFEAACREIGLAVHQSY